MLIGSSTTTSSGTQGKSAADAQKLQGDMDRFLTLLVTQLKNQDPLQPMDANQFTSQLVQFASVEQQINQNANLEKLLAAQQTGQLANAVGYIGTDVEADGDALPLQDGQAEAVYVLPSNAAQATLTIRDPSGRAVYTAPAEKTAGEHPLRWDGQSSDGTLLPDGAYTVAITARNAEGSTIDVTQRFVGRVTGVSTENGRTLLELGGIDLPAESARSVRAARPSTAVSSGT